MASVLMRPPCERVFDPAALREAEVATFGDDPTRSSAPLTRTVSLALSPTAACDLVLAFT